MKLMKMMMAAGTGLAAIAAAAPAAAQYGYANPYGYSQYGYSRYGSQYGYSGYGMNTGAAASQCTAAVQNRLMNRASIGGIIGSFLGTNTTGRVVSVTQVTPRRSSVTVRGLASSGRYAGYGPYGVGAYGAVGYGQPDLSFKCNVDYRGYVRDVDIHRRY